jgi:hypothetical protein
MTIYFNCLQAVTYQTRVALGGSIQDMYKVKMHWLGHILKNGQITFSMFQQNCNFRPPFCHYKMYQEKLGRVFHDRSASLTGSGGGGALEPNPAS